MGNCVGYADSAKTDLVKYAYIAERAMIIAIATVRLPPRSDLDEGTIDSTQGVFYRRAVSRSDAALMARDAFVGEDDARGAWNFYLIYRRASETEARAAECLDPDIPAVHVLRIVHVADLAGVLPAL